MGTIPDYKLNNFTRLFGGVVQVPAKDGGHIPVEMAICTLPALGKPTLCVKSNDLPLSYYEEIEGFVPATEVKKEDFSHAAWKPQVARDPVDVLVDEIFG